MAGSGNRERHVHLNRREVLRTGIGVAGAVAAGDPLGRHALAQAGKETGETDMQVVIGPDGSILEAEMAPGPITVFVARKIVTMNPANPEATHVAVRDGRILGAGSLEEVAGWGEYTLDETFAEKVLTPGLIEGHLHTIEGMMSTFPYLGFFDRPAVDGSTLKGVQTREEAIAYLKQLDEGMSDPGTPLITIGFDPIYFPGERMSAVDLDQVSTTRQIFLLHASGHVATVNSALMQQEGITRETMTDGVLKDESGEPIGELQEAAAMALARTAARILFAALNSDETIENLGKLARNAGVTLVTDLSGSILASPGSLATWQRIVEDPEFPSRVAIYNTPGLPGMTADWSAVAAGIKQLQENASSDKLRFPGVKFVLDGSIQANTAVMNWPGYYRGEDLGLLMVPPEQIVEQMRSFHAARIPIHAHCNGTATIDLFIDAIDHLVEERPWLDHRHTVQHSQLINGAQFRRMARLGMCANIFANHIWYWGDQHYELTVGPERANGMEPCASAKRMGIPFALHSDANVTPLGQLHSMWCAVNRVTPSGRVLGEEEKISAYDALYAVTLGVAYTMHLDAELGSIECGKWADFTVLDESPIDVEPMAIKDIPVWGTVVGGVKFPAAGA
jgi:predicted amidohydrolase YtcJ